MAASKTKTELDPQRLPRHIAIIMDGNGRWARERHLPRIAGHQAGVESVREAVETCAQLHIPALTLYAFSAENWKRPKTEVGFLMRLLRRYLRAELQELNENNIRLQAIGREADLPAGVREDLEQARHATQRNTGMVLTLALNYGARTELVDAFSAIVQQARHNGGLAHLKVDEQLIQSHLYTAGLPDPDLLIRTSGEMRVSNFLLWQIAYAEIWVTETLWPDFRRQHLLQALQDFQKRERRFGGLNEADQKA
ncbi:MAG: isoprenyl transferase [Terriglobales bacterium]